MGGELVESTAPQFLTDTEKFYNIFPYYLSIGMTSEMFWHDDCMLAKYYREAHKLKLEHENRYAWLQGKYMYDALCLASPMLHAFSKNPKPIPYHELPYGEKKKVDPEKVKAEFLDNWKARKAAWKAMHKSKVNGGDKDRADR